MIADETTMWPGDVVVSEGSVSIATKQGPTYLEF